EEPASPVPRRRVGRGRALGVGRRGAPGSDTRSTPDRLLRLTPGPSCYEGSHGTTSPGRGRAARGPPDRRQAEGGRRRLTVGGRGALTRVPTAKGESPAAPARRYQGGAVDAVLTGSLSAAAGGLSSFLVGLVRRRLRNDKHLRKALVEVAGAALAGAFLTAP